MVIIDEEFLAHYGTPRKSGRYPWGSGGDDETPPRNQDFLGYVDEMKKQGMSEAEIARGMGISTTKLRAQKTIAKAELRQQRINYAQRLKDKGWSTNAIAKNMEMPESSVRALLAPGASDKADILATTANMLRDEVASKKYVDIGLGVENHLHVSKERLNTAVAMLKEEGYVVHPVSITQLGTGHETRLKVLAAPGTTQKEIWTNRDQIRTITSYSDDGGRTRYGLLPPMTVHPRRVGINYAEDGGAEADGVIYVRQGIPDVSLGKARYAQVRIKVGEGHYLKGMAMYKDDLPDGVDLVFNTNKKDTGNKLDAMKPLSDDPDNPFGALVRQLGVDMDTDNARLTSAMNIVTEEGQWSDWSKSIASQVLSKQSPTLAKTQLNMTFERRQTELARISKLTNSTVRKKLLDDYAGAVDSDAVHLKAAELPRQGWYAILPIQSMSPTQVYAPRYFDGERVALIRYPHGGTFEIADVTVNNRHPEAKRLLGSAPDAIGINHQTAQRLSGADFDGDTVLVIPNGSGKIKITPVLEGLKNFDPKTSYPPYDGMHTIDGGTWNAKTKKVEYNERPASGRRKQQEMGNVSNLITDMTIQRASTEDVARAVRHSMVVIDSEKHSLDWRESARQNGIAQLKQKYQGGTRAGASTLISRAGADVWIPERKERSMREGGPVDPRTGRRVFVETGATRTTRTGQVVPKKIRSKQLAEEVDARALSTGTRMEELYADHSNKLKNLANQARLQSLGTPPMKWSPSAKKHYAKEVGELDAALALAKSNAPLERQAQVLANATVRARRADNPNMDEATKKKISYQALQEARRRTGADKQDIKITPEQWAAIQAGAISNYKLEQILNHANMEIVKQHATPRTELRLTGAEKTRALAMMASGYTMADVSRQLGVSTTTLQNSITVPKEEGKEEASA